jgi:phage regulator Rha-like protein
MFQLSSEEDQNLRLQFATSSSKQAVGHGGRRSAPFAFTEHGAIMVATVLNSKRAIEMSVFVVRAFVRLRELLNTNHKVSSKLLELERRLKGHDGVIRDIISAIRDLMAPPPKRRRKRIGFQRPAKVG